MARLIGLASPRFVPPAANSSAAERASVSRRVRNAKMRTLFSIELAYPSYREGLAAIIEAKS
jgi:hypothetical protein